MTLVAITGGIGSGKSVVATIVQVMGYEVYDCDRRAKALMTENNDVRQQITDAFGSESYHADCSLNRQHLSAAVFADKVALAHLNGIVHPGTAADMKRWAQSCADLGDRVAFVETALLRTAGLDRLVDEIWHVTAPHDVRIPRVMLRSGLTAAQVKERIDVQQIEENVAPGEHVIVNDGIKAVMPQVIQLLEAI